MKPFVVDCVDEPVELVVAAARCWRLARDADLATQPHLHALLSRRKCPMLAMAFDSLLHAYEQTLGRSFGVGATTDMSDDERLLGNLLQTDGHVPRCLAGDGEAATTLDCALCSTRILLALAGKDDD